MVKKWTESIKCRSICHRIPVKFDGVSSYMMESLDTWEMEEAERFTARQGKFLQLWGESLERSDVQSGKNLDTGQRDRGLK